MNPSNLHFNPIILYFLFMQNYQKFLDQIESIRNGTEPKHLIVECDAGLGDYQQRWSPLLDHIKDFMNQHKLDKHRIRATFKRSEIYGSVIFSLQIEHKICPDDPDYDFFSRRPIWLEGNTLSFLSDRSNPILDLLTRRTTLKDIFLNRTTKEFAFIEIGLQRDGKLAGVELNDSRMKTAQNVIQHWLIKSTGVSIPEEHPADKLYDDQHSADRGQGGPSRRPFP